MNGCVAPIIVQIGYEIDKGKLFERGGRKAKGSKPGSRRDSGDDSLAAVLYLRVFHLL